MMYCRNFVIAVCCGVLLSVGSVSMAAEGEVAGLIGELPVSPAAEGQKIIDKLVKLGPPAYEELCGMLTVPGKQNDAKVRFALHGLALHVSRRGAEAERKAFAAVLIDSLEAAEQRELKAFLIRQLQLAGRDDAVGPLAEYLDSDNLYEPATQALIRIGTDRAKAALAIALPDADKAKALTLVRALGRLRVKAAAKDIFEFSMSKDTDMRRTALWALANIGDPSAVEVLQKAASAKGRFERAVALDYCLLLAGRLAEGGDKARCASICRRLIKTCSASGEDNGVCSALSTLTDALGEAALEDLIKAADSKDKKIREAALKLAAGIPTEAAAKRWVAKLKSSRAEVRAAIVAMLGRESLPGDDVVAEAILQSLKDDDEAVRRSAIRAARRLGTQKTLAGLFDLLGTAKKSDVTAVRAELAYLPSEKVIPAAAAALPDVPPASRIALLRLLGNRKAEDHVEAVLDAAKDENGKVRLAALKAAGDLAGPDDLARLVSLLMSAENNRETAAAQRAIVAVAGKSPDKEGCADVVLAAMKKVDGSKRCKLIELLPGLGGGKALDAVARETKSADEQVRSAAIRALSKWSGAEATDDLIKIAAEADELKLHVLALRGYVRLVGASQECSASEKLDMLKKAMSTAKRVDDRKLVLSALGKVRSLKALKYVAEFLDDEGLSAEACLAAYAIAVPQEKGEPGLRGKVVQDVLTEVMATAKDENLQGEVKKYLLSLPRADEANVAMGKRVAASVKQQGDQALEFAVDGVSSDKAKSWWGEEWPCWMQVDLEEPTDIEAAQVFFYWDGGRWYQYTIDVSLDGKSWKTVVDRSKTKEKPTSKGFLHTFEVVRARYVRLNILKNSANEAVHVVEFKVFAAGELPEKAARAPEPDEDGFVPLFNGEDLTGWVGATKGYVAEAGKLVCLKAGGGNLFTEKEYGDFEFRFEFKLKRGANNGLAIRAPLEGNPAYASMELQILDNPAPKFAKLDPRQYHGSIYGVVAAERGHLKAIGEWNSQAVIADGPHLKVILNGATIVDSDLRKAAEAEVMGNGKRPGLLREKGHIGFLGHGSRVEFRNLKIKEL